MFAQMLEISDSPQSILYQKLIMSRGVIHHHDLMVVELTSTYTLCIYHH